MLMEKLCIARSRFLIKKQLFVLYQSKRYVLLKDFYPTLFFSTNKEVRKKILLLIVFQKITRFLMSLTTNYHAINNGKISVFIYS